MQHPLKAVLIDIDGTLLDSNDAHAKAWVDVLREQGHDVAFADVRPLIGKGGDKLLEAVVGFDDETDAGKALSDARKRVFKARYLLDTKPTPNRRSPIRTSSSQRCGRPGSNRTRP